MRQPALDSLLVAAFSLPLLFTLGCFGPSELAGEFLTGREPTSTKSLSELLPEDFIGKPTVDRSRPGLYLYHDGAGWNLLAQGGETTEKHVGVITSNAPFSEVEPLQFESNDVFTKAETRVNYTMVVQGGQDSIRFQRPSDPVEIARTLLLFTPFTEFTGQNVLSYPHEQQYEVENAELFLLLRPISLSGRQALLSKDGSNYKTGGHLIVYLQDDRVVVRMQDTAHDYQIESPPGLLTVGQFAVVKLAFGQGGMQLFVSNQLVASHPYAGGLSGNKQSLVVGASNWSDSSLRDYFHGTLMAYFLDATPRFVEPTTRLNISSLSAQERVYVGKDRIAVDTTSLAIPALSGASADASVSVPEPDAGYSADAPTPVDGAPPPADTAAPPGDTAPPQSNVKLVWTGDFEKGDFSQYRDHLYGEGTHTTKKIVTSPTRSGRFAAELTVLGNEYPVKERAELYTNTDIPGDPGVMDFQWDGPEYWVGFSFFFKQWDGEARTFFQIHAPGKNNYSTDCWLGGNTIALRGTGTNAEGKDTAIGLYVIEDGTKAKSQTGSCTGCKEVYRETIKTNVWHDWVMNFRLSTKGEGFFRVWKNGKIIYEKEGLTNVNIWTACGVLQKDYLPQDMWHHYGLNIGLYTTNDPWFRQMYIDEARIAVGSGRDGYALVVPGQQ